MPNIVPTTSYGWVVSDLRDLVVDLDRIALETGENITEVEASLCHFHLNKVLKSLFPATACQTYMAIPLPTDVVTDYLSITHRNIYRLPITPDQRV